MGETRGASHGLVRARVCMRLAFGDPSKAARLARFCFGLYFSVSRSRGAARISRGIPTIAQFELELDSFIYLSRHPECRERFGELSLDGGIISASEKDGLAVCCRILNDA